MDDALLPCPFCGGTDVAVRENGKRPNGTWAYWQVACDTCDIVCYPFDTRAESVALWNSRDTATMTPLQAALALPEMRELVEALGCVASSEAMTVPFYRKDNSEGKELSARIDFARAALAKLEAKT